MFPPYKFRVCFGHFIKGRIVWDESDLRCKKFIKNKLSHYFLYLYIQIS